MLLSTTDLTCFDNSVFKAFFFSFFSFVVVFKINILLCYIFQVGKRKALVSVSYLFILDDKLHEIRF